MYRIAFCGSHGTGKSTLLQNISSKLSVPIIDKTIRTFWEGIGVDDFEKLPVDVRSSCQYHLLLNQIRREDGEGVEGFVTDRSVLDYLAYTVVSSDMSGAIFQMYEALIKERLKKYTHFIYVPVEFEATPERLRAAPHLQKDVANVLEEYIANWFPDGGFLRVTGSVEERIKQVNQFLGIL